MEIIIHSWLRWFVVVGIFANLFIAYYAYFTNKEFNKFNRIFLNASVGFVHLQFVSGAILYYNSSLTSAFLDNIKDGMKNAELRFFSMEHALLLFIAIVLITVASFKVKRMPADAHKLKFKTIMIYFTIACILLLVAIPWKLRPLFA
ncbi:MAG: hypothetical protein HRT40_13485 [Campylobacteraceae bacterium]|nr:hypothetical protein [Campylobacteraceae bacterium]